MSPDAESVLDVAGLVKRFGGFRALDGLSLSVKCGEVLGLVGPNGSGKTTAINVICGLYAPSSGVIRYNGRNIVGMKPYALAMLGINRTFQSPHCFLSLTVRENITVATAYGGRRKVVDPVALLEGLELAELSNRPAGDLNSAQQKALDLARALATAPRLLLVDELAAGLNPAELSAIARRLRRLAREGMALLVVEHLLGFINKVADRVVVMNAGREIFEGQLKEAAKDRTVVEVFLGQRHAARPSSR